MDKTIRYRRHHIRQSIRRFKKNVPSVYITHQLNVMTGNTTWLTSKLHQSIIKNIRNAGFPIAGQPNLAGELSHSDNPLLPKYIGMLSRMHKKSTPKKYDLMVILRS
jgi:hypothetical protein